MNNILAQILNSAGNMDTGGPAQGTAGNPTSQMNPAQAFGQSPMIGSSDDAQSQVMSYFGDKGMQGYNDWYHTNRAGNKPKNWAQALQMLQDSPGSRIDPSNNTPQPLSYRGGDAGRMIQQPIPMQQGAVNPQSLLARIFGRG
jgi:hypothetical protein